MVNLAINYGSKLEILKAVKRSKGNITIKKIEGNLFTNKLPNPDILIRTAAIND